MFSDSEDDESTSSKHPTPSIHDELKRFERKMMCIWAFSAGFVITAFIIAFIISGTSLTDSDDVEAEIRAVEAALTALIRSLFMNTPVANIGSAPNTTINSLNNRLQLLQLQIMNMTSFGLGILQTLNTSLFRLEFSFKEVVGSLTSGSISTTNPCVALPPSSPSGYYWTRHTNGSLARIYCDMTRSCGGVTGGWMRVANMDVTDPDQECFDNFKFYNRTNTSVRTCVRMQQRMGGCSVNFFSNAGKRYSEVCGRIIGYQHGTTNAFGRPRGRTVWLLREGYVDGISLTHGSSVSDSKHIWTFASALQKTPAEANNRNNMISQCLCHIPGGSPSPPYVGNNYFCDSGNEIGLERRLYDTDPLWDGAGCMPSSTCCTFNNPPWFFTTLPNATNDSIIMRVCKTDFPSVEDVAISIVEIYVR